MKIVIWTQSAPKVEAIKEAIFKIPYFEGKDIEIIDIKVSSWISDMPTSIEENMIWAKNRALNSKNFWCRFLHLNGRMNKLLLRKKLFILSSLYTR